MAYGSTGNTNPGDGVVQQPVDPVVLQQYLSSLPTQFQGITPTYITNSSSTIDLTTSVGVISSNANVSVHADTRSALIVGDSSTVDFTSSQKADGSPVKLNVTLSGGSNSIALNYGPSVVHSTTGNDTITSAGGRDHLFGGTGMDSLVGGGQSVLTSGSSGSDTLVGGLSSEAADTIISSGGSHINTTLGSNLIIGGANDTIHAGSSQDTIFAGTGAETIRGGSGAEINGSGQSSIYGGGNGNTFNLSGQDSLHTLRGSNTVNIADGSQASVQGGAGHLDVNLSGGTGNDTLFGGSGGLTIHVTAATGGITGNTNTLDKDGYHIVQFASGETLHVSNVVIDFGNGHKTNV